MNKFSVCLIRRVPGVPRKVIPCNCTAVTDWHSSLIDTVDTDDLDWYRIAPSSNRSKRHHRPWVHLQQDPKWEGPVYILPSCFVVVVVVVVSSKKWHVGEWRQSNGLRRIQIRDLVISQFHEFVKVSSDKMSGNVPQHPVSQHHLLQHRRDATAGRSMERMHRRRVHAMSNNKGKARVFVCIFVAWNVNVCVLMCLFFMRWMM